jgi:hypothetical protein
MLIPIIIFAVSGVGVYVGFVLGYFAKEREVQQMLRDLSDAMYGGEKK